MSYKIVKHTFSTSMAKQAIHKVTVIGGGLMGSGIAQVAAQAGNDVILVDISKDVLQKAESVIKTNTGRVAKRRFKDKPDEAKHFIESSCARIKTSTNAKTATENSDLVIEAIVENMELKHALFKELDPVAPPKTIFASNTSSLSIKQIASVTSRKDKFVGLHFFNPVPVMQLLEVAKTEETSTETFNAVWDWGKLIGKTCIKCKDTPGFVVNRLLLPYLNEAIRMVERGDASVEDIDIAMRLGAGYPMGPFELADYSGHDTAKSVLDDWHRRFPDNPAFVPTETLNKLVKEGKLGRKTGEGFYKYN